MKRAFHFFIAHPASIFWIFLPHGLRPAEHDRQPSAKRMFHLSPSEDRFHESDRAGRKAYE
jgi:hypothetical protein